MTTNKIIAIKKFFSLKSESDIEENLLKCVYDFCQNNMIVTDWYSYETLYKCGGRIEREKPVIISRDSESYKAFSTAVAIEDVAETFLFKDSLEKLKTVLDSCSKDINRLKYLRKMLEKKYDDEQIEFCFKNEIFLNGEYHKKFDYTDIYNFVNEVDSIIIPLKYCTNIKIEHLCLFWGFLCKHNVLSLKRVLDVINKYIQGATDEKFDCIETAIVLWDFNIEELCLFIPILFNMDIVTLNKLKLYMSRSKKDELFKNIFNI